MKKNVKNAVVKLLKTYKKQCIFEINLESLGVKIPNINLFPIILDLIGFSSIKDKKLIKQMFTNVCDNYIYSYHATEMDVIRYLQSELSKYKSC